jgi:RNA polymerase sigma-70 factor (ECF subfamily)
LEGCKQGNRTCQDQLYRRFYGFALGICRRYTRSREEAIEGVNDGFYKIMTNLDKYTPGLSFKGWVRKIMVNSAIDHFRANEKHYNSVDISYSKNEQLTPGILSHLSEEVILHALQQLPPSYQIVFNLHVIEGYKHDEIAQKLNISVGTSRSNLNVARAKLKRMLSLEFEKKTEQNG